MLSLLFAELLKNHTLQILIFFLLSNTYSLYRNAENDSQGVYINTSHKYNQSLPPKKSKIELLIFCMLSVLTVSKRILNGCKRLLTDLSEKAAVVLSKILMLNIISKNQFTFY